MDVRVSVDAHSMLDARAFVTVFPVPLGEIPAASALSPFLSSSANAPLCSDDSVRARVRDLLRHGGYKPTGRGKPSSEYLIRAVGEGSLGPINPAVDACNAVSLHSGLPISVVDVERASPPFRIGIAPKDASYVFNASGQTIDVEGLLCLFDASGPCANGVKDAQRTKTHAGTRTTLSILWGARALGDRAAKAERWYRDLLEMHFSARTLDCTLILDGAQAGQE